jgi:hypothetical protein
MAMHDELTRLVVKDGTTGNGVVQDQFRKVLLKASLDERRLESAGFVPAIMVWAQPG